MSILGGIQNGQASVDNIRAAAKRIRILINFNCCQQKKKNEESSILDKESHFCNLRLSTTDKSCLSNQYLILLQYLQILNTYMIIKGYIQQKYLYI